MEIVEKGAKRQMFAGNLQICLKSFNNLIFGIQLLFSISEHFWFLVLVQRISLMLCFVINDCGNSV
jgi:hypothetical protein